MATETSNTIDIYGLTDWNEMVKVASAISVPKPTLVGGTIFYIDDTADGVYEFFDANGSLINGVDVGDAPYAYKVVTPGTKDKYYVYHDELYEGNWTYYKDGAYVYEYLGMSESIGSGKTNTEIVIAKDNGAYIAADSNGIPTIWYRLQQARLAKAGGCDDWFVPSKQEIEELRLAVESGSITGGVAAGSSYNTSVFESNALWSSSEDEGSSAWSWFNNAQRYLSTSKTEQVYVFFTRAF